MMGKTHIAVGVATALFAVQPNDIQGCMLGIVGGATGGILCDIEVRSNRRFRDALHARYIVAALVAIAFILGLATGSSTTKTLFNVDIRMLAVGSVLILATGTYSRLLSKHRGFSHSLLALALFTLGVGLVLAPLALAFAVGFLSHIVLDLLNKKPVQLLFPSKKANWCLRWCYANGTTNKVLLVLGCLGSVAGITLALI